MKSLDPVVHRSLREVATATLRQAIRDGVFRPGERILENEVADRIGISRAPIREALRELETEGLVVSEPHRGTFVVELSQVDLWEIYTLRAAVEGLAARLVTENSDAEALVELEQIVAEMKQVAQQSDPSRLARLDMRFHEVLCRASGHSRLLDVWVSMNDQIRTLIDLTNNLYLPAEEILQLHSEVVDHIQNGCGRLAEEALARHVLDVGQRICDQQIRDFHPSES